MSTAPRRYRLSLPVPLAEGSTLSASYGEDAVSARFLWVETELFAVGDEVRENYWLRVGDKPKPFRPGQFVLQCRGYDGIERLLPLLAKTAETGIASPRVTADFAPWSHEHHGGEKWMDADGPGGFTYTVFPLRSRHVDVAVRDANGVLAALLCAGLDAHAIDLLRSETEALRIGCAEILEQIDHRETTPSP